MRYLYLLGLSFIFHNSNMNSDQPTTMEAFAHESGMNIISNFFVETNGSKSQAQQSRETQNNFNEDIYVDSYHFTSTDGQEFWIPKCDKKSKPFVGQTFSNIDAAFEFYEEYGRLCGFDMRKSSSKYRSTLMTHKYMEFSSAGMNEEKKIKRRRTTTRRCDCEAKIVLNKDSPYTDSCFIHKFVEVHNHALATSAEKQFLRCNRKVTLFHQNFISDHRKANIGSIRSHSVLKEMVFDYENVGATAT
ncbi:hypothetical protein POM88_044949 [Heracleum sosnowskyi]|uniref:FAR1 domain-containing protein n=1 Tax=Heracleum sosnowskyi TaxID=360622 RepID=A0AAD8H6F8_9APIA|nr:hypothetical protein POM88_044949 [Heracleum sosnowskyi]